MYGFAYFTGTQKQINRVFSGDDDGKPVQVLYSWFTLPFRVYATPDAFVCSHETFTTTDILFKKNIHLLSLSKTEATFVELNEGIDAYNTRQYPILFLVQTQYARRVMKVPIDIFYKLANQLDVSDRHVVWMFHSVRCGSTAWAQVFNSLPGWSVISDSQSLYVTVSYCLDTPDMSSFAHTVEYSRMAQAIIKMNLSKMPAGQHVLWKGTVHDDHLIPIIAKHFPEHRMLFAYRNVLPSGVSFYKAFASIPFMKNKDAHLSKNPFDTSPYSSVKTTRLFYTNGYDWDMCKRVIDEVRPQGTFEWYMFMWAAKVTATLEARLKGVVIQPIKYEHLQSQPKITITKVLDYLGIPTEYVDTALKALEDDSQENTFFSRKRRARFADWIRTDESVRRCNQILQAFNLPSLDSDYIMDDTI